jgi:hypothetical protein
MPGPFAVVNFATRLVRECKCPSLLPLRDPDTYDHKWTKLVSEKSLQVDCLDQHTSFWGNKQASDEHAQSVIREYEQGGQAGNQHTSRGRSGAKRKRKGGWGNSTNNQQRRQQNDSHNQNGCFNCGELGHHAHVCPHSNRSYDSVRAPPPSQHAHWTHSQVKQQKQ